MERTYNRGEENYNKSRKPHKNMPSFSSLLLDEIYRSIDGNAQDFKIHKEKKQSCFMEDEEISSFRRACLVEKWMEKEINEKAAVRRRQDPSLLSEIESKSFPDNDSFFFSSTSSSSDSSGQLSSSDTEFFGPVTKPKVSCFSTRLKPVRTGETTRKEKEDPFFRTDDDLIKSKSRALKIYSNLKKMKQPISPGGKLTSFINSILNNVNGGKKSKNLVETNKKIFQDLKGSSDKGTSSTCSSASSFSRSCLSKYSPKSREKMRDGIQRTVRFNPVSVVVDEDSRTCGHKSIYDQDYSFVNRYGRPPLPTNVSKLNLREEIKNLERDHRQKKDDCSKFRKIRDQMEYDDEDEDAMSDSSSDLFELDHLVFFGNNRFCEELPVYETTHLDTNRAIASGLFR